MQKILLKERGYISQKKRDTWHELPSGLDSMVAHDFVRDVVQVELMELMGVSDILEMIESYLLEHIKEPKEGETTMTKTMLTQEQATALQDMLNTAEGIKSHVITAHVEINLTDRATIAPEWQCIYDLPLDTVASALYLGYDIEKTPHEKLKERYVNVKSSCISYNRGVMIGIVDTLNTLGIEVEGINK